MIYAVMEQVGNFAHTVEEFDCLDTASEFVLDRATETALESFNYEHRADIPELEFEEELELALSYYSIDRWSEL